MKILEQIKEYPSDTKLALVIRHGDREPIPKGEFGNELMLNEKGRQNSIAFGESLRGFEVKRILTSPIARCVQTAKLIVQGYGSDIKIEATNFLGDPGLHISDEKKAGEAYLSLGLHEVLKRFVRNEAILGIHDAKHLRAAMADFIHQNTTQSGLTIFITHDSLLAMYHFCLDGTVYTTHNWVSYLDGLIYKINKKNELATHKNISRQHAFCV